MKNSTYIFRCTIVLFSFLASLSTFSQTCVTTISSYPYTESFEGSGSGGFGAWVQDTGDFMNWSTTTGQTPSGGTGPLNASNLNYYIFTEASGSGSPNRTAFLNSPCFDLTATSNPNFSFDYHMYGSNMGNLKIQVSTNNGTTWSDIGWSQNGQLQTAGADAWVTANIDLSTYVGQTIKLRFHGTTGNGYRSDISVDNVNLTDVAVGSCSSTVNTFPYNEGFEGTGTGGIGAWIQDTSDDGNWTIGTGFTPSGGTGPTGAVEGTYYLFTESSSGSSPGSPGNTAFLNSPCFDLTGLTNPEFSFSYHMKGTNMGTLKIQVSTNNGTTWNDIGWSRTGQQHANHSTPWSMATIDLASYIGQTIMLRFHGTTGSDYTSDMCIDGVSLVDIATLTGPGGVTSNLKLWLKSTNGLSYTDGQNVSLWQDSGNGSDATVNTAGQEPTYRNNATHNINFNPVVDFDNGVSPGLDGDYSYDDTSTEFLEGTSGMYTQDIFVVLVPDVTPINSSFGSMDIFCGDRQPGTNETDGTGIGYGAYTARFSGEVFCYALGTQSGSTGYGVADTSSSNNYDNPGIINTRNNSAATQQELYYNALNVETTQHDIPSFANVSGSRYWIGRSEGWEASTDARIAEIITYSARKSDASLTDERNRIQSYLAIKYGITLGVNGTSQDYVDSNGTVIWDQSASGYNYDIAGIGRDDSAELNQKQSKTVNTVDDITIGLGDITTTNSANSNTFDADRHYLLWGNDKGTLAAQPPIVVDMSAGISGLNTIVQFTSIGRTWKLVENGGDIGNVKVSIPETMLSATLTPPGSYLMFVSDSPTFSPTSDYSVMTLNGSNLETTYDFDGIKYITFGYAPQVVVERSVFFDGTNDYIDVGDHKDLNSTEFTVSAWIKRSPGSGNKTIFSKRDASYTQGYDVKITSGGNLEMSWINGGLQTITGATYIPENEWHHVSVIYNNGTTNLYIDGVLDQTASLSAPVSTNESFIIAAAGKTSTTDLFVGNIDEVRIWDVALSLNQLRYIMNQEIEENATFVDGMELPTSISKNEVGSIPWSNLAGYYPMSIYTYTNTNDHSVNKDQGALRNLDTVDFQTAPLPYESNASSNWDLSTTWLNGSVNMIPGSTSIVDSNTSVDWNIVRTNHNITVDNYSTVPVSNNLNRNLLGLMVDSNTLTVGATPYNSSEGFGLTITHYLELNGKIDLEGESQLVQTNNSVLTVGSNGSLERDQQGTSDTYTYNYWSSPVGFVNTTATNATYKSRYTVPNILLNGTVETSPTAINFLTSGYDGTSSPFGIADYWIWKFANQLDDDYSAWQHMRSTGSIYAGEGFTMKGPGTGSIATPQNYVFRGKPNNGDITLTISANNDYLVGNPYASAINALEFLSDNPQTDGTLYFWEHWGGGSHILGDYQGGYAQYNYAGGVGAASYGTNDPDVGTGGTATKLPGQYIPVSQGFFVYSPGGGTITFENDQRQFRKESSGNSTFMRTTNTENQSINYNEDNRMKFRIGFNSFNQIHRQLLLTVDDNASPGIDWGYEGKMNEEQIDDMYWMIENGKYIIQGTNTVNTETVAPLGIHVRDDGMNYITIDHLENVPDDVEIYAHDNVLNVYHNLRNSDYQVYLTSGNYLDRFAIVFTAPTTLDVENNELNNSFEVFYNNDSENIVIHNPNILEVNSLELFNILGQSIFYSNEIESQNYIEAKVSNLNAGTYIINLNTISGKISKKILVN